MKPKYHRFLLTKLKKSKNHLFGTLEKLEKEVPKEVVTRHGMRSGTTIKKNGIIVGGINPLTGR